MKFPLSAMIAAALGGIVGVPGDARGQGADPQSRPNIVLILADDLGYGDVASYNPESKIPTPNLDRLAAQGIRFTDAHAAAAVCTPSRYGLLTGQYPWRTRPGGGAIGPWAPPVIAKERVTLPALLRHAGYATAAIGKWHLGWGWPTTDGKPPMTRPDHSSNVDFGRAIAEGPTTRGFDYYFGVDVPNFPPFCFIENDRVVGLPSEPTDEFETPGPRLPGWSLEAILPELTRRAVRYIEAAAKTPAPFFLYFSLTSPHHPIVPTAEFRGKSGAGDYGDFVVQTDWTVGEVLAALERAKIADRTLVIFSSDNGPEITRKDTAGTKVVVPIGAYDRIQRYGHASMGPWRGIKYEAWEGGHREPFIARWPTQIKPGAVSSELLCLTDMMATCAAITGVRIPSSAGEDSYNALPTLLGGKGLREGAVLAGVHKVLAVRSGDWVWIDAPGPRNPEPDWFQKMRGYTSNRYPEQLYNLRDDAAERFNRLGEEPGKLTELRAWLESVKTSGRSPDTKR